MTPPEDLFLQNRTHFCDVCYKANEDDTATAQGRVLDLLEMLVANDDLFVQPHVLSKILIANHGSDCASRKQAKTWISSAVTAGLVVEFKEDKSKQICLARLHIEAVSPFPPDSVDTTLEEDFVRDLLWESPGGCLPRLKVIESLKTNFARMDKPFLRSAVLLRGDGQKFFLAKSPYGQAVALTLKDAHAALEALRHSAPNRSSTGGTDDPDSSPSNCSSTSSVSTSSGSTCD